MRRSPVAASHDDETPVLVRPEPDSVVTVGVAVAAVLVAVGMRILVGWGWIGAAMFGVLIAATDPVSVIAAFKEMKIEPRLSLLVEAESLLNDGAAAVGFTVLVAIAGGSAVAPAAITGLFLWKVLGGVIVGGGGLQGDCCCSQAARRIIWSRSP